MRKLVSLSILIILVMALSLAGLSVNVSARPLAATSPPLGAAESYSVLAGSIVTNTGDTTMPGNLGISPSIGVPPHSTGFPPGSVGPPGEIHDADAHAAAAQFDATAAFTSLDQDCTTTYPGVVDLVGANLVPGVYCADAFELSGTLTLSGSGVWIFKSAATLITSGTANVVGGNALDVWWRVVSSATLGTYTKLIGNILASTSISLKTGASLNGRALAQTGAVTLESNTIFGPICLAKLTATAATGTAIAAATQTAIAATSTPTTPAATQTAIAAATQTSIAATATPTTTPVVPGLPISGGAPIRNDGSPWGLLIAGGFSALTLFLGVRAYRKVSKPRQ